MRFVLLVVALFGFLAVLLGALRLRAESGKEGIERGRAHVEQTCVGCHAGPELDIVVSRFVSDDRSPLDAFLAKHHVADQEIRVDVIAYLEARLAAASLER